MQDRKYRFSWELLGNLDQGRPHMGRSLRLEVYRLMQFTLRDVIEEHNGTEMTDRIFYQAGELAGRELYRNALADVKEFGVFVKTLQELLRDLGIGILRVEESDLDQGKLVVTVCEDLDCSGLPDLGYQTCIYDEGFLAGLLESFTGTPYRVKEIDCWSTGERTCRFLAEREQ